MRFACPSEYFKPPVGPYWLGPPSWVLVSPTDLRGLPRWPSSRVCETPSHPLLDLAPLQSIAHGRLPSKRHPLRRFVCSSTHKAPGSDRHRVCLARLCYAFRLSQPLDVLLLPKPFWLCFTPVAPLSFSLQRFSPLALPTRPFGRSAPPDVATRSRWYKPVSSPSVARCELTSPEVTGSPPHFIAEVRWSQ
jgi:hypothetical protein